MDDQLFKADDGSALRFYYGPLKNNFQSEKHGQPIFDTVLYVEVITPGSTESVPVFDVERTYCEEAGVDAKGERLVERSGHYERYKSQIESFKANTGEHASNGLPITQWAQVDAGTAATLRAQGVHTVEMLSEVSDGNLSKLGTGGRILRAQAQQFLASRQFGVPSAQLAAQVTNMEAELDRVNRENADLKALLAKQPASVAVPSSLSAPALDAADGNLDGLTTLGAGAVVQPPPAPSLSLGGAPPAPLII